MRSILRFKFMRMIWLILAVGGCAFLIGSETAYAQAAPPAAPAAGAKPAAKGGNKRTEINFEDQLIEGSASKPGIFFFMQQKGNNFKKLIKLRENFLPEMRRTSDEIVRKGSGT